MDSTGAERYVEYEINSHTKCETQRNFVQIYFKLFNHQHKILVSLRSF